MHSSVGGRPTAQWKHPGNPAATFIRWTPLCAIGEEQMDGQNQELLNTGFEASRIARLMRKDSEPCGPEQGDFRAVKIKDSQAAKRNQAR